MITESRPWGKFEILSEDTHFRVKRITVNPGQRLSLQVHTDKIEMWYIVSGSGSVTIDKNKTHCIPGNTFIINPFTKHRISNKHTSEELVLIELAGSRHEVLEDDIYRIEDDYGRQIQ